MVKQREELNYRDGEREGERKNFYEVRMECFMNRNKFREIFF